MNRKSSSPSPTESRTWFYWFIVILAVYSLIWDSLLAVDFITHPFVSDTTFGSPLPRILIALVIVPAILIVAWLVFQRAPKNVVGLLLVTWSATIMSASLRVDSPLANFGSNFIWPTVIILPFYFPDGRPSPRRIGWLINLLAAACYVSLALTILTGLPILQSGDSSQTTMAVTNALYVPALAPLAPVVFRITGFSVGMIVILLIPSLVIRFRRADQRERLQMKWLGCFSVLFLFAGAAVASTGLFANSHADGNLGLAIMGTFYLYFSLFIPMSVANAIFRHRLYDIDILIRHTVIYSTVTAILVLVYLGGIVLMQSVFRALTGQTSDLAIVISTLAIAALFTPVRQRIQTGIDRRFYRRKYDVEQTLTAFNISVRNEVNLDKLTAALIGVVQETMQPAQVSLWLREPVENNANSSSSTTLSS